MGSVKASAASAGDVVRVVTSGRTISVSINGWTALVVTDTFHQTATLHGFRIGGATSTSAVRLDNMSIA